jgi:hypothetical protein
VVHVLLQLVKTVRASALLQKLGLGYTQKTNEKRQIDFEIERDGKRAYDEPQCKRRCRGSQFGLERRGKEATGCEPHRKCYLSIVKERSPGAVNKKDRNSKATEREEARGQTSDSKVTHVLLGTVGVLKLITRAVGLHGTTNVGGFGPDDLHTTQQQE